MKVKHIIVIFIVGLTFMALVALFKIMSWPGAGILLIISTFLKFTAGLLAIWKVLTINKFKEFLNS